MNDLRNLRKAKGLSISQLSEMTGIPGRTLEDWDGEKRQIQAFHRIKALSECLGCTMEDLMTKRVKCLYDGHDAVLKLVQEENAVRFGILYRDKVDRKGHYLCGDIPREKALELLKQLNIKKEVKGFLFEYIEEQ